MVLALPLAAVFATAVAASPAASSPSLDGPAAPLTLDAVVAPAALVGTTPVAPAWSPDGARLAFLWSDRAGSQRSLWMEVRGKSLLPLAGPDVPAEEAAAVPAVTELAWEPGGEALVVLAGDEVWRVPADGGAAGRLTTDGAGWSGKSGLQVSPDGRLASWLRDGDLWVVAIEGGSARRLTQVGVPPIGPLPLGTYRRPDVEIGPGVWSGPSAAYRWSPDGRFVAVHHVDRTRVRKVEIPHYLGAEAVMNVVRRASPGDENEARRIGLLEVATGKLRFLDLPDPASTAVITLAWSPSGKLLVDRASDTQVDRWVHLADPVTGEVALAWHDRRETRIYTELASAWHPDGRRILLTGDLDDHYRLYVLTPGEASPAPLTPADSDVAGAAIPVPATGDVVYVSSEPRPEERQVWRLPAGGGPRVRLSGRPGTHQPFPSPDGTQVALLSSDDVTPPELWVVGAGGGGSARRITRSPPAAFSKVPWVKARYLSVPARDGKTFLHLRILEPPGARGRRVPTVLGPVYTNTVRNRWGGTWGLLQQHLVIGRGWRVVQVDSRGSTGHGRAFREAFLMDWGNGDLDDHEDVVRWLATQPGVDPARVGIFGSSYGGTVTVFSLFRKPGLFAAGVAGAPATDPRWYGSDDVAVARTPQTHPDAFVRGAAVRYAEGLRDPLLIVHGLGDDVVPFKTTVDLLDRLAVLGKDVELAVGPQAAHGWTRGPDARYLLGRLVAFLDRYLGPGAPAERARRTGPRAGDAAAGERQ